MIYMTPYDPTTKQWTAASQPAGFNELHEVRAMMGEPLSTHSGQLIYGDDTLRVVFSRTLMYLGDEQDG